MTPHFLKALVALGEIPLFLRNSLLFFRMLGERECLLKDQSTKTSSKCNMANLKVYFAVLAVFLYHPVLGIDFSRLSDDCVKSRKIQSPKAVECTTPKGVKIEKYTENDQTFYCISYEKKAGKLDDFDVLSFDLHEDYDLQLVSRFYIILSDRDHANERTFKTGSNVISDAPTNPKFKLYDSRAQPVYKGRFALSSNNSDFDIESIKINAEAQVCKKNEQQVWPLPEKKSSTTPAPNENQTENEIGCGQIKKSDSIDFLDLPSSPGEFPWYVAIYRNFDDEEETYYKCSGTIIGKRTIVTSFNCLLEDGLLLDRSELQVYVAPFSLSCKKQKSKSYKISKVNIHAGVNYQLDNNVAVLELNRDIMFNDFVQPICIPAEDYNPEGKIGKV